MSTTTSTGGQAPALPATVSPDGKLSRPDQYHAGRKIETLLDVSDMVRNAGIVLRDEICPAIAKEKISKTDQTKCLRKLQRVVDVLLGSQEVVAAATRRICPLIKGTALAHDTSKKEKKRRINDSLLSNRRKTTQSMSMIELNFFHKEHIETPSQPEVMVLDSSSVGAALPLGPSTRSAASLPDPIRRLPMPRRGVDAKYDPQEIMAWLIEEDNLIEEKRASKEKGVREMMRDFKAAKQHLVDHRRVDCSAKNLNRLLRTYRNCPGDAPT